MSSQYHGVMASPTRHPQGRRSTTTGSSFDQRGQISIHLSWRDPYQLDCLYSDSTLTIGHCGCCLNFHLHAIERCLRCVAELNEYAGCTRDHIAGSRLKRDMSKVPHA